jgi:hypothetical protein
VSAHERLAAAARRVLDGDDSIAAARALEAVIVEDYLGDERLEELLYILSMYSPAGGPPYTDAATLRREVAVGLQTLDEVDPLQADDDETPGARTD